MWKKLFVAGVLCVAAYQYWTGGSAAPVTTDILLDYPLDLSRPLALSDAPVQRSINSRGHAYEFSGYRLRPLASFQLHARVLGVKWYRHGREAELSPVDLALGWGAMADDRVLAKVDIKQSGRFYRWRVERLPVARRVIETQSANMHMIPGSHEVADALAQVEEGQQLELHGYLVRIDAADGWRWKSSLTRKDTGARACELVLVQHLDLL